MIKINSKNKLLYKEAIVVYLDGSSHKLQMMYERRMDLLKDDITHNEDAKQVAKSQKELNKLIKQAKECKDYYEKIGHIAILRIDIELDDGVKVNYDKVQTDDKGKKYKILAKI